MWKQITAIIFGLFLLCFVAIVIEEVFLGGRRRRRAEKESRTRGNSAGPAGP